MRIAVLYHGTLPVKGYGGTERVVVWLVRGLAALGHEVTLLAAPGSRVPEATLVGVDPKHAASPGFDARPYLPPGIEVLHAHRPLGPQDVPTLWTMHGTRRPGASYPDNMIALSADHATRIGASTWVHNGLDPAEYSFAGQKAGYDLFLGRLHSTKGWRWAVEGARQSGRRLVVAGGWRPTIRPDLSFRGTVEGKEKAALLAEAACLWMPANWDEPFGLTLIEALVSGTPVLGTRRGSLPEIITPDTGALGDTLEELVALREGIGGIDPEVCRARVESHFTHLAMAREYQRLYGALVRGESLPAGRLATRN